MPEGADEEVKPRRRDWGITMVLIGIWVLGLKYVTDARPEIPRSMLVLGTIFFLVLIPSMKELVRSIERLIAPEVGDKDH